jgi:hypothetical protein
MGPSLRNRWNQKIGRPHWGAPTMHAFGMKGDSKLVVFRNKQICRIMHNSECWFVVELKNDTCLTSCTPCHAERVG